MILSLVLAVTAVHPATEWAHEEFTNYTTRIFGTAPEVRFVLPGETDDFVADFKALRGTDGYAVRTRDETIVFVADNPRGHVNGVHRWLERNSDIIWPRPAKDLCFFTPACQRTTLATASRRLSPVDTRREDASGTVSDYREVPAFRQRVFGFETADAEVMRWRARNAMGTLIHGDPGRNDPAWRYGIYGAFMDSYGFGHSMERLWMPRSEFLVAHPEWYMLNDGKRGSGPSCNFCETNPELPAAYAKSVLAKIRNLPRSVRILQIMMEDTSLTCQCAACLRPIRLEDGTVIGPEDPAFKSTRFFIFFNRVADLIGRERPDLTIQQFAYHHLTVPPKVKVAPNVTLLFCPFPRNMKESVIEGPSNRAWRDRTDEWLLNTTNLYWREYYFDGGLFPRPIADTAAVDLRYVNACGVRDVSCEAPDSHGDRKDFNLRRINRPASWFFDMSAMEAWTVGKLYWDPSLDPKALRQEFLRRTFGPAAEAVGEFYALVHRAWYADDRVSRYDDNVFANAAHYIVRGGIDGKCREALARAETLADRPERKAWIADMRGILEKWVREASNYAAVGFTVPYSADGSARAEFPELKLGGCDQGLDITRSVFRIGADATSFHVELEAKKPFVEGEWAEIAFATGVFRLEQKTKSAKGWTAAVRVPFADIGFDPKRAVTLKCLPRLMLKDSVKATPLDFSWCAGVPEHPEKWGEVQVEMERKTER